MDGSFDKNEMDQDEIVSPSLFKQLFLTIVENTYSNKVMSNLNFMLLTKLVTKTIDNIVNENQAAIPSVEFFKTRIRASKQVDPYKSVTFTFEKETDLFFASTKH